MCWRVYNTYLACPHIVHVESTRCKWFMWRQILLDQGYPFEDPQVLALLQQCGGPDARILRQMEVGCCKVCEDYMRREYEKVQVTERLKSMTRLEEAGPANNAALLRPHEAETGSGNHTIEGAAPPRPRLVPEDVTRQITTTPEGRPLPPILLPRAAAMAALSAQSNGVTGGVVQVTRNSAAGNGPFHPILQPTEASTAPTQADDAAAGNRALDPMLQPRAASATQAQTDDVPDFVIQFLRRANGWQV